ncbi:MAG: hypothetical protein ACXVFN_12395 [Solirubrobacteraceae bacterium]
MMLAAIDIGKLFELLWAATLAGILVSVAFSLALVGLTRAAEHRRDRRRGAATAYGVMGFVALAVFLGAVVFGISVIVAK